MWRVANGLYNAGIDRPVVNFINILHAHFVPILWQQQIAKPNVIREKLLNLLFYEKCSHKMLMKLTPVFCDPMFTTYVFDSYKLSSLRLGNK